MPEDQQTPEYPTDEKIDTFINSHKMALTVFFIGFCLLGLGIFYYKSNDTGGDKVEILKNSTENQAENGVVVVEIAGAIINPGVYEMPSTARINDLINKAGGFSDKADNEWIVKTINKAAKLIDGQKIYIKSLDEQSEVLSAKSDSGYQTVSYGNSAEIGGMININSASKEQLESINGIGPVYAQNIIDQRPYSSIEELVSRGVIKQFLFDKIKNTISVY